MSGGGGNAGATESITQSSPAKPTWAQILNSNPASSANASTGNNNNNAAAAVASNKTKTVSPSTSAAMNANSSRSGPTSNFYEQQPSQSQMNWSLNFNQTSTWMIDDDSQKHSTNPTNSSQQSMDGGDHSTTVGNSASGGDGFDRLESSSPATERNKSAGNGWSNIQQPHSMNNPSRSNPSSSQWFDTSNFYGTNSSNTAGSYNFSQHSNDSASNTWQDPSASNADTISSSSNPSVINKHKASSTASSIVGTMKSNLSLASTNVDQFGGSNDAMINYIPQPKLVEQLGWDEPDIQVTKRPNFDDGTSIWGDPMDSATVPVKKWTDGTKAALKNTTNTIPSQATPPPASSVVAGTPTAAVIAPSQAMVQKSAPTGNSSSQMVLNNENWPKQQSPTLGQPPISQWNDSSVTSNLDTMSLPQQGPFRNPSNNWNTHSVRTGGGHGEDWFTEGVIDTSGWGLQGPPHKVPFDPYEGQIDTSGWGVSSGGGMPGAMSGMLRNRFPNEYNVSDNLHDPHQGRMSSYDGSSFNDHYRPNPDGKSSMMGIGNIQPLSSNIPPNQHPFVPRPSPLYPQPSDNLSRPINSTGGLSTPPGAIIGQGNLLSPKLPTSSPIPPQNPGVSMSGKSSTIPNHLSQTPTPQQHLPGNGNNPNGNNNGGVHAQIMQQFRLAVQAGLISQDLLNTKLPAHMLQLLQKLFEFQQKFQHFSFQLSELNKQKSRFPVTVFQNEYDRLSKSIQQKKQEMLSVQKEIQDAHNKLKQQQQSGNLNPSPMMNNVPSASNPEQSRLHQWTKQSNPGGQRSGMFPAPPPGIPPKDWQTDNHDSNDNWDQSQTNESNVNNSIGNVDTQIHHHHHHQASSGSFNDSFSGLVDDIDGPPPFVPGQLWNWKSPLANAEDDPHVTPTSFIMGPKGLPSPMGNLNVGGTDSAFTNPQLMHQYQRHQQSNRSQWQQGFLHDPQNFAPTMNDWNKQQQQQQQQQQAQQQYRGTSKPPHPSFGGGYRPYT